MDTTHRGERPSSTQNDRPADHRGGRSSYHPTHQLTEPSLGSESETPSLPKFTAYRSNWRRFSNLAHMRLEGYPNLTHRSVDMLQCSDSPTKASSSLCTSNRLWPAPAAPWVREVQRRWEQSARARPNFECVYATCPRHYGVSPVLSTIRVDVLRPNDER
jgi:hypothetical protein